MPVVCARRDHRLAFPAAALRRVVVHGTIAALAALAAGVARIRLVSGERCGPGLL